MDNPEERLALRTDAQDGAHLDDVVVNRVETFRAEMLAEDALWLACYLPETGVDGDRVTFLMTVQDGELRLEVEERPAGSVTTRAGSAPSRA